MEGSISSGSGYFCAVSVASNVYCWGSDQETYASIKEPTIVPAAKDEKFVSVGVGLRHVCALSKSGKVYCKGKGYNGELGTGAAEAVVKDLTVPVSQGDLSFKILSVGLNHACAITVGKDLYCWGDNEYGQLGTGDLTSYSVPVLVGSNYEQISAGGDHTCGVKTNSEGFCWGNNDFHQSSTKDDFDIVVPTKVKGSWDSIYSGYAYTLGIDTKGNGFGWGQSEIIGADSAMGGFLAQGKDFCLDLKTGAILCSPNGSVQAGGMATFERYPTPMKGNKKWSSFAPGSVPCGIEKKTKYLHCWGYTAGEAYAPGSPGTTVPSLVNKNQWEQASGGISGARCGIDVKGSGYCWGRNIYDCGEVCPLGDGTERNSKQPAKLSAVCTWRSNQAVGLLGELSQSMNDTLVESYGNEMNKTDPPAAAPVVNGTTTAEENESTTGTEVETTTEETNPMETNPEQAAAPQPKSENTGKITSSGMITSGALLGIIVATFFNLHTL